MLSLCKGALASSNIALIRAYIIERVVENQGDLSSPCKLPFIMLTTHESDFAYISCFSGA